MKKMLCALSIIAGFVYMIGCIGSYDNGTMTFTTLAINSMIALTVVYGGFYLIDKGGENR